MDPTNSSWSYSLFSVRHPYRTRQYHGMFNLIFWDYEYGHKDENEGNN